MTNHLTAEHRADVQARRSRAAPARRLATHSLALFTALALCALFATTAGATNVGAHTKVCGSISGPHWTWGGSSGTGYTVYSAKGAPCALALTWAPRLVGQRPHAPNKQGANLNGPAGWGCLAMATTIPHSGYCVSGTNAVFGWGPLVKHR